MPADMEIIEFELMGLSLQEPMGLLLNLVISISCFIFIKKVQVVKQGDFAWWWKYFFLFFGISTFFGGLGHLFYQYTGLYGKIPAWTFGLIANLFSARAMLTFIGPNKLKNWLIGIVFIKFVTFFILMLNTLNFKFVSGDATFSFVGYVLVIGLILFIKERKKHWLLAVIGSVCLMPAALFNGLKIDFHLWFNRQDAAHVFMLIALFVFYLASKKYFQNTSHTVLNEN